MSLYCCSRVLIIDDNDIDLFISEKVMRNMNFAEFIDTVTGVDTALIKLSSGKELPELIFLGLYSQSKGALDFLSELQAFPKWIRDIRVVILTAASFVQDEKAVREYPQVIDYVQKPLGTQVLQSLCNK